MKKKKVWKKIEDRRQARVEKTMRCTPIEYRGFFCHEQTCGKCPNCFGKFYGYITIDQWRDWLDKNKALTK